MQLYVYIYDNNKLLLRNNRMYLAIIIHTNSTSALCVYMFFIITAYALLGKQYNLKVYWKYQGQ